MYGNGCPTVFTSTRRPWWIDVASLVTGASETITVPAMSVVQTGIPANSGSSATGSVQLGLSTDSSDVWSAYGTTNDNTTGDGWVSRAKRFAAQ